MSKNPKKERKKEREKESNREREGKQGNRSQASNLYLTVISS
jgi:hypothetical protein